jgi:MGT family glycosyltransferase
MSHLALFLFPDYGHLKPTLELSRELVRRGHRVTYVTDERYAALVEDADATAVTYTSRRGRLGSGQSVGVEDLGAIGVEFLIETIESVLPHAESSFAGDVPDAVLYDFESFAVARMLARRWSRPTVQLVPYLAANEKVSPRQEMFDPEHPAMARGHAALMEFIARNGLALQDVPRFAAESDDRNLVFLPRPFQPEGDSFDDRFVFVGPALDPDDGGEGAWHPPAGRDVLLASLGTESNERKDFFGAFAEGFQGGSWHVVLTLGRDADPGAPGLDAPHLEAHSWLPHPRVLPHAKAFVCHGGMGSIMEALYYGTPVVVVPHTPEHRLNARRVTELGLGATLPPERFTAQTLRAAVDEVADDPRIRENTARMRRAARDAGGVRRAADVLAGWTGLRQG